MSGQITSSTGAQYWRGDWYANSASEDRSNAFYVKELNDSSSACVFIASGGADARDNAGWSLTDGSAYVKYVGSSIGTLIPGCTVTGDGIPDGTFLKRYISGQNLIELSQTATATIASGTLHLAAHHPVTTGRIKTLYASSSGNHTFNAYMPTSGGSFTLYAGDYRVPYAYTNTVDCSTYPAKIVVSNTVNTAGAVSFRNKTHFRFPRPTSGTAGFSKAKRLAFLDQASTARIEVDADVAAVYTNVMVTGAKHTIVKDGAGSLLMDCVRSLTTIASPLKVEEGTLALAPRADSATCASLTLSADATFKVACGTVALGALTAASGAAIEAASGASVDLSALGTLPTGLRLTGSGVFLITSPGVVAQAEVGPDASVKMKVEGSVRGFRGTEAVVPAVVGEPAFWVQADKNVSTFTSNGVNQVSGASFNVSGCVSRWLDCRATPGSDAYRTYYATNDYTQVPHDHGYAPPRVGTYGGMTCIRHSGNAAFATDSAGIENSRKIMTGLVWNKPITNIWAVFAVVYEDGGLAQAVLGRTRRFPDEMGSTGFGDFCRGLGTSYGDAAGIGSPGKVGVLSTKASSNVKNGWIYWDGRQITWDTIVNNANNFEIFEMHPKGTPGKADAFAIQDLPGIQTDDERITDCGCQIQVETIIYTNQLTQAEREQVCAYLLKKYRAQTYVSASGVSRYDAIAGGYFADFSLPGDDRFALTVDEMLFADRLSGTGTFVLKGAGTFYADLVDGMSLQVEGGRMVVHSAATPASYGALPAKHFLHWDAANTNSLDLVALQSDGINDGWDEEGNVKAGYVYTQVITNMVNHWYDARYGHDGVHVYGTARKSSSYRAGWLVTNAVNGLPAVDYGPIFNYKTDMWMPRRKFHEFHLTDANETVRSNPITSLFMVKNAAAGGNQVLGDTHSGYGITRSATTADYTTPIANVAGVSAMLNGVAVDPTTTGYSGGWDQLALHFPTSCQANLLGANTTFTVHGGMMVGEVMIYTNALGWADARTADAYLANKWFNRPLPYAAPSTAGAVSVAAGATLAVEGGAPLTAKSLSGAGTVEGSVRLTADAEVDVVINEDGSIAVSAPTVTGALDLSAGGTVRVTGHLEKVRSGTYPILTAASVTGGNWTLVAGPARCVLRLKTGPASLNLVATSPGHLFFVR